MDAQRRKLLLLIAVVAAIGAISFFSYWQKTSVTDIATTGAPMTAQQASAASGSGEAVVYISGAVNKPGVYKVSPNTRVVDALNTAGGLAAGADASRLNLAQPVKDGLHIYVPLTGDKNGSRPAAAEAAGGKININTADKAALDKLPGIGPALAERIIEYRQANGPFRDITDIKKVSGIGDAKYQQIKDKITL